ncbi:unnamed protein product [Lactuca saligna]|uniref:Leucine-rich repeat-containing N-terminal plant-type domain-containing protein n=1 Tax=Lactuca saligna TaxID=75948 RepID=A0AA35ZCV3_LACSI|nr:unnamed protein product [Lactuca saligna]
MNPCVFVIFSLLLLDLETTTSNQLGGGDENGVIMRKCSDMERRALLDFKARLQDPDETLSTWRAEEEECCNWSGVTCNNQTGRVIELNISSGGLEGEISNYLLNLSYLTHLDLFSNSFHGIIPTFIGSMTRLRYLHLGSNHLNGTIPRSIGCLTELRELYLSDNSLYGIIPLEFGNLTNLQVLNLGSLGKCRAGNLEWLSHLSHLVALEMAGISLAKQNYWVDVIVSLRKLSFLSIGGCELSQVMYPYSSSFLNSSSSIQSLYLGNNSLNSSMYRWLFPLTSSKLRCLDISRNMLDGIPKYLGNLCNLERLYFYNNFAVVKFPDFLNNLSGCTSLTLQGLYVGHNRLIGTLSNETLRFKNLSILGMKSCNLGPHFPRWIQTLKNISYLDIANNRISDTIPLGFWDMWPSQLTYLNLSSNNISGKAPDLSSKSGYISMIDLSSNRFYGPITNVSSTLTSLHLSRNKFYGGISFLCQINQGFLVILDLSHNFLSGQIPDCLWHFKELKILNLEHNNLSGRLPTSVGSLIKLESLDLYKNNFSGELPVSLKSCTSLNSLNLGANKFCGNVPLWIGENLLKLYVLILRSNNFFRTIPLQLCQLEGIRILDLSVNNLHGTIPLCLGNLTSMIQEGFLPTHNVHSYSVKFFYSGGYLYDERDDKYIDHAVIEWKGYEREFIKNLGLLKSIDLSSNNLTGQIPYEVTKLYGLRALNLSQNGLHGEIPEKIGQLKQLETLDLSRNNLSGEMPLSMSSMNFLNQLDVSYNSLSGRIPSSTQLQSIDPSRYIGNPRLCGPPLTKKCHGDDESKVPHVIGESEDGGEDTDEFWGWFYIGGGTGFATGFWIACGALLLNRRGRHAFFHFYDRCKDLVYVKVMVFFANLQRVEHR